MPSRYPQAVVFDAVGTLIYPDPPVAVAYTAIARQLGSALSTLEVGRRFQSAFDAAEQQDLRGDLSTSETAEIARWQRIVRQVLDDVTRPDECFRCLFEHFGRPESWQLFDDVAPALEILMSRGIRLAIASNFDSRLHRVAQGFEPLTRCEAILTSTEIGFRKPHRRFFESICQSLALEPDSVLYIGDDPINDLRGAQQCGLRAQIVERGASPTHRANHSLVQLLVRHSPSSSDD